jgi:uncharacterized protein
LSTSSPSPWRDHQNDLQTPSTPFTAVPRRSVPRSGAPGGVRVSASLTAPYFGVKVARKSVRKARADLRRLPEQEEQIMAMFVFRLIAPRPTFALDMSDEEREIMGRHAAHWQPLIDSGQMVVFGPVLDDTGSWGLGVVEAEDEDELRAMATRDPVVTTGTGRIEMGKMLTGFVRPGGSTRPGPRSA